MKAAEALRLANTFKALVFHGAIKSVVLQGTHYEERTMTPEEIKSYEHSQISAYFYIPRKKQLLVLKTDYSFEVCTPEFRDNVTSKFDW